MILVILISSMYLVLSLFVKKLTNKKKYALYILGIGLFISTIIYSGGPLIVKTMTYMSYAGPSFQEFKNLRSFLESKTWIAGDCDIVSYQFHDDGTFVYQIQTDYPIPPTKGTWTLQDLGRGKGILTLTSSRLFNPSVQKVDIQADGKLLNISSKSFHGK